MSFGLESVYPVCSIGSITSYWSYILDFPLLSTVGLPSVELVLSGHIPVTCKT